MTVWDIFMLLSRAESAQYLAEKLPLKTAPQWQTFLNDNAKNRNSPKIKFKSSGGRGSKSFYEQTALDDFAESLKPPKHLNRTAKVMEVYGMHHKENITTEGRALGWRDFKLSVHPVSPGQRDNGISMQFHIQTGSDSDLKVGAFTIAEAKAWAKEILDGVALAERTSGRL